MIVAYYVQNGKIKNAVLETILRGKKPLKVKEIHLNHTFNFTFPNQLWALPHAWKAVVEEL